MISSKEQVTILCKRYHISASVAAKNAKLDREIFDTRETERYLKTIKSYNQYLTDMEGLGA